MKQILFLLITVCSVTFASAQNVIERHFDYLLEQEDATHINVTGKMFELMNNINIETDDVDSQKEVAEMQDFISSIRSFELLAVESMPAARSRYDRSHDVLSGEYEELLSINDKKGSFFLFIDEHNGTVHEVVGIGTDNESMLVFSLLGDMKLDQVGQIAQTVNNAGMGSQISKVKDLEIGDVKVYPNPASSNGVLNLETSKGFQGGVATLFDASGASVKTYKISSMDQTLQLDNLSPGNYVMKITQGEVSMKKKVLIVR